MNYIDIVIILILIYGAYKGFSKGLIVEIATLLALVLGVFISIKCSHYTEKVMIEYFEITSKYLPYIALAVTFVLVAIGIYLLGKVLTALINIISLGLFNKLLGLLLGAAKACIIICVILLLVDVLNDKFLFLDKETQEKSLFFNPFLNFAQQIYNMIGL